MLKRILIPIIAILVIFVPSINKSIVTPTAFTVVDVDAHDGMMYQSAGTYYIVGTKYGCGFNWGVVSTPWCGFSVYSAQNANGPWTFVRTLFPTSDTSTYDGTSWQHVCGDTGSGCFNPRMNMRSDGVWVLWFNGPYDEIHYNANGYYVMGCNGPAGPCGASAGPPYGTTHKPAIHRCRNSGDFSIVVDNTTAWMICNTNTYILTTEQLNIWWTDGLNIGSEVTGVTNVEAPGAYKDANGTWVVTYSDPACGYCAGSATGFATAPALTGPWTWPTNATSSGGDAGARRKISANSCGGQPRTIVTIDGQPYQMIDIWYGVRNETNAALHFEPLISSGSAYHVTSTGMPLIGPYQPFTCTG